MKKVFFIAALLLTSLLTTAQVKISRGGSVPPSVEIKFKRCIVSGESGYIDLLVTNHGKDCYLYISDVTSCLLYDDEGNIIRANDYNNDERIVFEFAGKRSNWLIEDRFPSEVPMALRVNIKGVNEFATEFTMIKIPFWSLAWGNNGGDITLRNVPIERRD